MDFINLRHFFNNLLDQACVPRSETILENPFKEFLWDGCPSEFFLFYTFIYVYICRHKQNQYLEYIRKEWNLLNVCKEWDASNFFSCETWDINLHFIQVLQLTWVSRIVPGKKKPSFLLFLTVVNQNREINSTCYNGSWNKYRIYLWVLKVHETFQIV